VTYERPAIEQRVEVSNPVIAGLSAGSTPTTPTWTHADVDGKRQERP
jgi:hypothetical protein